VFNGAKESAAQGHGPGQPGVRSGRAGAHARGPGRSATNRYSTTGTARSACPARGADEPRLGPFALPNNGNLSTPPTLRSSLDHLAGEFTSTTDSKLSPLRSRSGGWGSGWSGNQGRRQSPVAVAFSLANVRRRLCVRDVYRGAPYCVVTSRKARGPVGEQRILAVSTSSALPK